KAQFVRFFETVQVYVEEQPRRRFEFMKPLANEHSVRAEIDMFPASDDLLDEASQFGIDERLAAADGNDRRAAPIQGIEALFDGELFADRIRVLAEPPATDAREIPRLHWFVHHPERKLLSNS